MKSSQSLIGVYTAFYRHIFQTKMIEHKLFFFISWRKKKKIDET